MQSPPNFIEKPIKLISFDSLGHAILHQDAVAYIQGLSAPISVLCVAGPYRTGKSYLLNQIIGTSHPHDQFQVGNTTQSCTKGLWVWGKPVLAVNAKGQIANVLLVDTEGFGAIDDQNDQRIITLALLISTVFIYNSKGTIDKDSLEQLEYIIGIAREFKKESNEHWDTDFHWVLRDFHLQLTNQLGSQISTNQYMQSSFSSYEKVSPQTILTLNSYFQNRSCHTFPSPETDSEDGEQRPEFLQQILKFKKIFQSVPSLDLDGSTFVEILEAFTNAMNENYEKHAIIKQGKQCLLRRFFIQKFNIALAKINLEQIESFYKLEMIVNELKEQILAAYEDKSEHATDQGILQEEITAIADELYCTFDKISRRTHKKIGKDGNKVCRKELKLSLKVIDEEMKSDKHIKSSNRTDSQTQLKVRQQLEGKVHRYELQLRQMKGENELLMRDLGQVQMEKQLIQEEHNSLKEQFFMIEKRLSTQRLEIEQEREKAKQQKLMLTSEIVTLKQLYEEKVQFLEQRLANLEINQNESEQNLLKKYIHQIQFLQKENIEMGVRHEQEIEEIKNIYKQCSHCTESGELSEGENMAPERMRSELRDFQMQIDELKEKAYQDSLQISSKNNELKLLQEELSSLHNRLATELQAAEKRTKDREEHAKQLLERQIETKSKLIEELTQQLHMATQEKKRISEELESKCSTHEQQTAEIMKNYEDRLEEYKRLHAENQNQLAILQQRLAQRQKDSTRLMAKMQEIKQEKAQSNDQISELIHQITVLTQNMVNQEQQYERQYGELKETIENLQTQLKASEEKSQEMSQQRNNLHLIELSRAEQRIAALTVSLSKQQSLGEECLELKATILELEEEIADLGNKLASNESKRSNLQREKERLEEQNEKMNKIIHELNCRIKEGQAELHELLGQSSCENTARENKYFSLLDKFHDKEKELCRVLQSQQAAQKGFESQKKQLQERFTEQTTKLRDCLDRQREIKEALEGRLNEAEGKAINYERQICLLSQKCEYLAQVIEMKSQSVEKDGQKELKRYESLLAGLESKLRSSEAQKHEYLQRIQTLEKDSRETCMSIIEMQKTHRKHCDQYESNSRLMRKKTRELEGENTSMKAQLSKLLDEMRMLQQTKKLVEQNYQADFRLWVGKLETSEEHVRRLLSKK